jgi:hypothetical protein
MPNKKVDVSVSFSGGNKPDLDITVSPWACDVAQNDTVEWVPKGSVLWIQIGTTVTPPGWPFPTTPPDPIYTGHTGKHPKSDKCNGILPKGSRVRYTITLAFTDDVGNQRVATIDPDMVMN